MRRLILLGVGILALLGCYTQTPLEAATIITTPDPMSVACSAGYTRAQPHYCVATSASESWNIGATGCNTHTLTTAPASARYVKVQVGVNIKGSNAVNLKQVTTAFYNDAACATPIISFPFQIQEFVAVAGNANVFYTNYVHDAQVYNGTVVTNTTFTNTGVGTVVPIFILGYID